MTISTLHILLIAFALLLLVLNILASREIYCWTPSTKKQFALHVLVWLLPIIGLYLAYKLGGVDWFKRDKNNGGSSVIAGGFMEADTVFNPGMRHRIEVVEKQQTNTLRENKQESNKTNPK